MIHAASVGVVLSLLTHPGGPPDDLSEPTREALIAAVTAAEPPGGAPSTLPAQAIALDAALDAALDGALDGAPTPLSPAEITLLREWLRRLSTPDSTPRS